MSGIGVLKNEDISQKSLSYSLEKYSTVEITSLGTESMFSLSIFAVTFLIFMISNC